MDIGGNIKRIREEKRLSQAEMSRRLNLDPSAYFRLEKRSEKLTFEQIENFAKALEVSVSEIIFSDAKDITPKTDNKEIEDLKNRVAELERSNNLLEGNSYILEDISKKFIKGLLELSYKVLISKIPHQIEGLDGLLNDTINSDSRDIIKKNVDLESHKLLLGVITEISQQGFFKVMLRDILLKDEKNFKSLLFLHYFVSKDYSDEEIKKDLLKTLGNVKKNKTTEELIETFSEMLLPSLYATIVLSRDKL